jgi:hypothetical protein
MAFENVFLVEESPSRTQSFLDQNTSIINLLNKSMLSQSILIEQKTLSKSNKRFIRTKSILGSKSRLESKLLNEPQINTEKFEDGYHLVNDLKLMRN